MNATTNHPAAGTYYPATPGARTLAEVTPLVINGHRVSAVVDGDGSYTVFAGSDILATGQLDGTEGNPMEYFAAEAIIATTEIEAEEIVSANVQQVRDMAVERLAEADALDAKLAGLNGSEYRIPRLRNGEQRGWVTLAENDPRHPANSAAHLRREAAKLAAWTEADEDGYKQYVSDGLADTDGHYAPLDRAAWKNS